MVRRFLSVFSVAAGLVAIASLILQILLLTGAQEAYLRRWADSHIGWPLAIGEAAALVLAAVAYMFWSMKFVVNQRGASVGAAAFASFGLAAIGV